MNLTTSTPIPAPSPKRFGAQGKNGPYKACFKDGSLSIEGQYADGMKTEVLISQFIDQPISQETNMNHDERVETTPIRLHLLADRLIG